MNKMQSPNTPAVARKSVLAKLFAAAPTLAVLTAISGVAYFGHRTGWAAPKFAEVAGKAEAPKEDWCVEHNVPDSRCIKCHPELVGANMKDWCPEHGLPESKCTLCHPELLITGVAGDWCPEHAIPETSCTKCHPEIAIKGKAPPSPLGAIVSAGPEATAELLAAVSQPARTGKAVKDPKTCQTHALRVQFASPDAVRKAGIQLGQVVERPMTATLLANAEAQYDRNRVAQLSSPVSGRVWRVEKQIGDSVKKGELIALIDAAEVGRAKADLLQSAADQELKTQTVKRLRSSTESGFRTGAELQEAEAAVKAAAIRIFNSRQTLINLGLQIDSDTQQAVDEKSLRFIGLPEDLVKSLDPATTTANLLPLLAPFDGVVTARSAVVGEVVEPSKPFLVIADTQRMWITADLSPTDARRIKTGQLVTFQPDGAADEPSVGRVAWISTSLDDQTRTVKVRADVENDGRLLANTFGRAQITIRESAKAVAVPADAVQWEGCCYVVFVRMTDDIFQTRKVKLGTKVNGYQEVLIGLLPGEVVATAGSHVLKSEILKSALGAGCCVAEEPKS